MYAQKEASSDEARQLRRLGGAWLADLRRSAGLTQKELADALSLEYYTFVSQLENGTGRVPPNLLLAYANAVGVTPRDFVLHYLKFYDPFVYQALTYPEGRPNAPNGDHSAFRDSTPPPSNLAVVGARHRSGR